MLKAEVGVRNETKDVLRVAFQARQLERQKIARALPI